VLGGRVFGGGGGGRHELPNFEQLYQASTQHKKFKLSWLCAVSAQKPVSEGGKWDAKFVRAKTESKARRQSWEAELGG